MTCGQVFVCCSATTLGIAVCCDIASRPKSIHCVLVVIRLLPICRARLRERLVLTFGSKSACRGPTAIGMFLVYCLFVIFHLVGCIAPISRSSPEYRVHTGIGLSPICCTPATIRIFVRCGSSASGLIPVRIKIGIHLSWSVSPHTSIDVGLLLGVGFVPPARGWSRILPRVGSVALTMGRSVSGVFFEGFHLWTGSGPPAYYLAFTIFS